VLCRRAQPAVGNFITLRTVAGLGQAGDPFADAETTAHAVAGNSLQFTTIASRKRVRSTLAAWRKFVLLEVAQALFSALV
jgi:hypothetical protein